ncbi:7TM-DISM domain-containing protein [Flavobacterium algicola]|uniref:7TM-DISM domain-containing protein n=1 Tax=Flavobacterium algicola TaxID=556529 RepID=UPI001EFCE4D8|nr:7TM-DISM domain-containing protein [Flavobacterium algicola]MCG9791050.1 hypothetical protein [Flavobacterium algicola]
MVFSNSYSQFVIKQNNLVNDIDLHHFATVLNLHDNAITLTDAMVQFETIKFKLHPVDQEYFGFSNDNYWLKVNIQNATEKTLTYLL